MSQLIDKLNRTAKGVAQPLGFHAAKPQAAKSQMLLIAALVGETLNGLSGHIAGADAVLVRSVGTDAKALQKLVKSLDDLPWGAWLKDADIRGVGAINEAGADFVVLSPAGNVAAGLKADKVGKLLHVEASLADSLLRAASDLPVDAVLFDGAPSAALTWQDLLQFQRCALLVSKPLLVAAPPELTADEMETLWKIGVDGLVVEVSREQPADRLKDLRQIISKMEHAPRKRGKVSALVPSLSAPAAAEAEEEEEEEDE